MVNTRITPLTEQIEKCKAAQKKGEEKKEEESEEKESTGINT